MTVRNDHVFLKTLGGLLPVDVILRRLHDEDCDPLELRSNSPLGVPGLLQAARVGNVTIANSIGSGIVETPAFMAYLPALCQALLGERLQLPNVATWWCGDPASRAYVLQNLNRLVVKPAFRRGWQEDIIGNQISQQSRDRLKQLIESRPMEFVGQEFVSRSVTPVWGGDQALPWHVALRTYGVATGESYTAMMGGLTRASFSSGLLDLRISSGERSKDCWIVSNRPVRPVSLLTPPGSPVELRRSGSELPSRVADNLYWLGRNVERAEGAARLARTILIRLTGESDVLSIPELPILLRGLASQGQIEAGFAVQGLREQLPSIVNAIPLAIFDESEPRSLHASVTAMHRTASIVRDRISIDSWRIINKIVQDLTPQGASKLMDVGEALSRIDQMIIDLAAFTGMAMDSMTRNEIWWFLDIGRRIERALHTISLLQDSLVESLPQPAPVLQAVLEAADSSMTYRSRYLANLQVAPVLDLLLTDETNPRSVVFQFVALNEHISHLPRNPNRAQRGEDERLVMSALNSIRMVDIEHLCVAREGGNRKALDALLSKLSQQLPKLSEAISHRYLIHAGQSHQLAEIRPSQDR